MKNVASETRAIMKKGSKTFSFAAILFDRQSREGAQLLYTWCRACDDAVDNEPDRQKALVKLQGLRENTARAFRGEDSNDLTFTAFSLLHLKHGIEESHAQALLDGMQMDVEGAHIPDDDTLKLYCYRVAGVVGLMMSKMMGVTDPRAHQHAVDTGLAMQMTNIARDIREDLERNRVYLPTTWLAKSNMQVKHFPGSSFAPLAKRLVDEAEVLYRSGEQGLRYLPLRAALAVACAQSIYREIGRQVVRRGERAWDSRTVVTLPKKIALALRAVTRVLASRAFRMNFDSNAFQSRLELAKRKRLL
jgi:phytoene synthase